MPSDLSHRNRLVRKEAFRLLARRIRDTGEQPLQDTEIAAALGLKSGRMVGKMLCASDPHSLGAHDIVALPRPMARALLVDMAAAIGCVLADAPPASVATGDVLKEQAEAMQAYGELQVTVSIANADGRISEREMALIDVRAKAAISEALGMIEAARRTVS